MKKKGFTLIELLAVIVILAIIALIATPIVMNVIENSRKGAVERSADNYLRAVETAIATARLDDKIVEDGTYELAAIEAIVGEIEVSGQKASEATILVRDGQVLDGTTLKVNNYIVNIVDGSGKVGEFGTVVNDIPGQTTAITYNPKTGTKGCVQDDEDCFGWYVLEDKGKNYAYVSLIMDRNITDETIAWCGDENRCKTDGKADNSKGPITAINYLKSQTSDWTVVPTLPTYTQIYPLKTSSSPIWLYDYLDSTTNSVSDVEGYWLLTPYARDQRYAWYFDNIGNFNFISVVSKGKAGVRPVITILKDNLS